MDVSELVRGVLFFFDFLGAPADDIEPLFFFDFEAEVPMVL